MTNLGKDEKPGKMAVGGSAFYIAVSLLFIADGF
jgi:hypothetical protein